MNDELIKEAQHLLDRCKISLMQNKDFTFYTALLFQLKIEWTDKVPMAAVNEETMFLNPQYWVDRYAEGHTDDILHETMHLVLMHPVRMNIHKGTNRDKYNYAGDISINNMLIDAGRKLDNTFVIERKYKNKSTEEIYNLIPNPPKNYKPDVQPSDKKKDKSNSEIEEKIKEMLSTAKVQAESNNSFSLLPADIQRHIKELLEPVLDWKTILANYMSELTKEDYSWRRPSRRSEDLYLPSLLSDGFGEISCYIDCSGSINQKQYTEFLSEIQGIKTVLNPSKVNIYNWGSKMDDPIEVLADEDLMEKAQLKNLGGTNIKPVLQSIRNTKPEISVIYTDGQFSDCKIKPSTDVIWVIVDNPGFKSDVGRIIHYTK